MAVKTNITINIVEPGSDVPVPDTGLFTHGIGGTETTIIVSAALVTVLVILSIVLTTYMYRKHKKQGKNTKLVHLVDSTKAVFTNKKRVTIGLTALALLASVGTLTALLSSTNRNNTNAIEGEEGLTINAESKELTIEVKDQPVFAVLPVQVTVEEATQAGYTLTAYTDNTDLISTTNANNKISMVALPETAGELSPLTDNTYGLALGEEPITKDAEVYMPLSIDSDIPTIIKSMPEYTPTAENDTTTIYYGFYITPDIPYGTYTNDSEVYYNATINTTPVTFDGNGLYFNEDEQQTTNEVEYIAVPEEGKEYNINQIVSGEYKEPSQDSPYNFIGWSTDPEATVPTYETEEKIAEFLPISPNTPITLYAVWQKATTITFNGNGADSGTMDTQTIIAGESDSLYENTFVKDDYHFTGWNTVAEPTEQEPGKSYADEELYQAGAEPANVTLYAQWKEDILYMQNVSEWGSSLEIGDELIAVDNRDDKEYYVARLKDGNIWMTQNLDLCIGCEDAVMLTSENTDLNTTSNPSGAYNNGYSSVSTTLIWSPTAAANSIEGGDTHIYSSDSTGDDIVYNSLSECTAVGHSVADCKHYHVGNYYNWIAAIASNGGISDGTSFEAGNSICPKGWKLPSAGSQNSGFGELFLSTGIVFEHDSAEYTFDEFNTLRTEPYYLTRGGMYSSSTLSDHSQYGYYWGNKRLYIYDYPKSAEGAYYFKLGASSVSFGDYGRYGHVIMDKNNNSLSIRCVAR